MLGVLPFSTVMLYMLHRKNIKEPTYLYEIFNFCLRTGIVASAHLLKKNFYYNIPKKFLKVILQCLC